MTICGACGYPNDDQEHRCEQCGRRFEFDDYVEEAEAAPPPPPSEPPVLTPAGPPVVSQATQDVNSTQRLREEVSTRVQRFRQKRQAQALLPLEFSSADHEATKTAPPPPQTVDLSRKVIPFQEIAEARGVIIEEQQAPQVPEETPASAVTPAPAPAIPHSAPAPHSAPDSALRARGSDSQLPFSFPSAPVAEELACPVAPVPARVLSGMVDAAVLACGYALFFGAYTFMDGKFPLQKHALVALAGAAALVAVAYFVLALYCGTATAGMRWVGLRVVDFDGHPAPRDRRALRLFGLCGSAAALGAGFFWAFVDEQKLTWHDRVSRTFLTGEILED